MPSPFPGMDPFIEASGRWGDFHLGMIAAMRGELNRRLPRGFVAEADLYVWFHEPDASARGQRVNPDVYLREQGQRCKRKSSTAVLDGGARLTFPTVERRQRRYLRIVDQQTRRVVTVLELLSPSNKDPREDRDVYLAKRNEYLATRVNVVEIDLLRGGSRLPLSEPPPRMKDYYVLVIRAWEFPRFDFWTFGLRDPLPSFPVPLAAGVNDVTLPLRQCLDEAYDRGRYREELPYDKPSSPRPRKADAAWLRDLLQSANP